MMKLILVLIVCICGSAAFAGIGLVEFSCDGLVVFEGARSVKTAGIPGVTNSLVLEAGTWRVGAKAFEVVGGEVLRLGELTGKDGQPTHETKPSGKAGKLRVTAAEKEEWRLWGEDVWREGSAEATLPTGVYRLEWRENEAVQGRLLAVDEDQQVPLAIPHMPQVLAESKTEDEMLVGPKREGPPRLGDVVVLRDDQSVVVGWQRLQKPVEQIFNSAASVVPLVTFHSLARKTAIESIRKRLGIGTPVDSSAAQSLALTAAEAEDGLGLFSLAVNYLDGVGTTKNPERAEALFQKAVPKLLADTEKKDAWAQTALGWCYCEGLGVLKSERKAADLFHESAQTNLAWAQGSLGLCYLYGKGVAKNAITAFRLLRKSSDQGDVGSLFSLAHCFASGEGVARDIGQAVLLTRKAAESGFVVAQAALGSCLLAGDGLEKNIEEGIKWTQKAADQGNASAQYNLGLCYHVGTGLSKDAILAAKWYRKAADQSNAAAQGALGMAYATGEGVDKNFSEAFFWHSKSAANGIATSQLALGVLYANGQGVKQDIPTAISWLRKAAKQGLTEAEDLLQQLDANHDSNQTRARLEEMRRMRDEQSKRRGM